MTRSCRCSTWWSFCTSRRTSGSPRLLARERERYGANIDPGGSQYESNRFFMNAAEGYETGEYPIQNLPNARAWLARLPCPVIAIEGAVPLEESLAIVLAA
jgi:hypothetical protein